MIKNITLTNDTSLLNRKLNRKVDRFKLYFKSQFLEALSLKRRYATTYDTVHRFSSTRKTYLAINISFKLNKVKSLVYSIK